MDRKFNTASLLMMYLSMDEEEANRRIFWQEEKPNELICSLKGGLRITQRVLQRQEDYLQHDLLETAEFSQQIFDDPASTVRAKASTAYTKYRWRTLETGISQDNPGQPLIVATQIISEYVSPNDSQNTMLATLGKPVANFYYNMQFFPVSKNNL